ncbi:MAG TPA: ATP-binding protein, partial [Burkholderiaceae bacterium]|nr:ATP-binding protein [Burkholderiaceae bacterium]
MHDEPLRILLIDDSPDDRALVGREIRKVVPGARISGTGTPEGLEEAIADGGWDVAVTDYQLMWSDGIEVFRRIRAALPALPVIMFTASGSEEIAVAALKEGLDDYITKTAKHYGRIPYAVLACAERARQRRTIEDARRRHADVELALRASESRLQLALHAAGMVAWEAGADGRLSVSESAREVVGREWTSVDDAFAQVLPPDRARLAALHRRALRTGGGYSCDLRARHAASGETIRLELRAHGIAPADGRGALVRGVALDVTARRRADEEIVRRRRELQAILDVLPVGIAITHDRDAADVRISPRFARLVGLGDPAGDASPSTLSPRDWPFRVLRDGRELPPHELPLPRTARSGEEQHDVYLDLVFADGRTMNVVVDCAPLRDAGGAVHGAVASIFDVTALSRTQRELEAADRRKNEFLAMLAHELRNPMAPIRYATAVLRARPTGPTADRAIATIERQSAQMARLLDDLLDISRITRGIVELRRAVLDLREVAAGVIETARPDAEAMRHAVSLAAPADPVWVDGDEARLRQVVENLVGNAIKYTPLGGRIDVSIRVRDGRLAELEVADTGVGLEPGALGSVFELFTQGHRGLAAAQSGLGIGLSVAKRLVELHGGTIEARSDGTGRGAAFTVRLPVAPAPDGAAAARP